jgi:phosphoglycolate phosphatase
MNRSTTDAILFDLDGTLTDPLTGIATSVQHALTGLGGRPRTHSELAAYIGPPLRGTFGMLLETEDSLVIEHAMALYRERYGVVGLFENEVYPAVPAMLAELHAAGYALYIATGKPRIYALKIVAHFGFAQYFSGVYGSELDGRFDNKAELLEHLLQVEGIDAARAVMIGDRSHDIVAAKANGIPSIGITYGYGPLEELTGAGADIILASPTEIAAFFRS